MLAGCRVNGPPTADSAAIRAFTDRHGISQVLDGMRDGAGAAARAVMPRPDTKAAIAEDMARAHELARVLAECRRRLEQPPVVIKGQALAHTLYPHPWQRPRGDVDVMIDAGALQPLSRALEQMGYTRAPAVEGDLVLTQAAFHRPATGIEHVWDVHWEISNRPALADAITYRALVDSAIEVPVGRTAFLAPDRAHALLIACVHLVGHHLGEPRLIWLYDIYLLVQALCDAERERLVARVKGEAALQAACHRALSVTSYYLPGERLEGLIGTLDPGESRRWPEQERYLSRLMDDARAAGPGNRLRLAFQHLFPARRYMMRRFGIRHRWQLPFWYGIRIARALPKLFRWR